MLNLLKDSPSLHRELGLGLEEDYADAVRFAVIETGRLRQEFPRTCPWTADDALSGVDDG